MADHGSFPGEDINTGFQPHRPCSTNGQPCQECSSLIELESELEVARKVYTDLSARHLAMKTTVNQAHDPLSRRIPTEIVARIFDLSVPRLTTVGTDKQVVPDDFDYSAPLKLGAVCATWRAIAWSTPRLWTFISIRFNPLKFPTREILAQQWLQRSGCHPLYLFLYATDLDITHSNKDVRKKALHPLIKTINACSDRWRVLDVGLPTSLLNLLQPGSATKTCASIHTLRLTYKPCADESPVDEALTAPSLAPIAISFFRLRSPSVNINLDQLTIACLANFRLEDAIEFLKSVPQLTSYTLQTQVANSTEEAPLLVYTHTKLTRLQVKNVPNTFKLFFEVITLPALQHLTLDCSEGPTMSTPIAIPILPILTAFLDRSQCLLTRLSFTIRSQSQQLSDILPLLYAAPLLEELTLEVQTHPPSHGLIFRQFAEAYSKSKSSAQTTAALLPNLLYYKHREFGRQQDRFVWGSLVEMLTASAADLKTAVNQHPLPKMAVSLISERPNRAYKRNELRLSDDKLIDKDRTSDFTQIIQNGVLFKFGIYEMYYIVDEKSTSLSPYYYDLIEASMKFHQFPQKDIDSYAAWALSHPIDE